MKPEEDKLIVALDVDTLEEARSLVDMLSPVVNIFKIGSQLFTACGPAAVRFLLARNKKVFLDLKYHDIPNTVTNAIRSAVGLGSAVYSADQPKNKINSIFMYTMHIQGGKEMLQKAADSARQKASQIGVAEPLALGITVLTSEEKRDNIQKLVLERALLAKESGLDGVVASAQETSALRKEFGKDFIIVTPGIRAADAEKSDQKRTATAAEAIKMGSSFLVVGRPIVKSQDPLASAKKILEEINKI